MPTLLWADLTNRYVWILMLATLAFGAIGFADDYMKVVKKRNLGLTARRKIGWPGRDRAGGSAIALYALALAEPEAYSTRVHVPLLQDS